MLVEIDRLWVMRPTTTPSRSTSRSAATRKPNASGDALLRNPITGIALLRARRDRPRGRRAAEQRDELAPSQVEHRLPPQVPPASYAARGCLGRVGLPHLQLAAGGINRFGADLKRSEIEG